MVDAYRAHFLVDYMCDHLEQPTYLILYSVALQVDEKLPLSIAADQRRDEFIDSFQSTMNDLKSWLKKNRDDYYNTLNSSFPLADKKLQPRVWDNLLTEIVTYHSRLLSGPGGPSVPTSGYFFCYQLLENMALTLYRCPLLLYPEADVVTKISNVENVFRLIRQCIWRTVRVCVPVGELLRHGAAYEPIKVVDESGPRVAELLKEQARLRHDNTQLQDKMDKILKRLSGSLSVPGARGSEGGSPSRAPAAAVTKSPVRSPRKEVEKQQQAEPSRSRFGDAKAVAALSTSGGEDPVYGGFDATALQKNFKDEKNGIFDHLKPGSDDDADEEAEEGPMSSLTVHLPTVKKKDPQAVRVDDEGEEDGSD